MRTQRLPAAVPTRDDLSRRAVPLLATLAVVLDVATTAWIVHSPSYVDLNLVVAWLEPFGPWIALGVLAVFDLLVLACCWLREDWLGTAAGVFLLVAPGAGGLNNLVLFSTGVSVMGVLGGSLAVHALVPAVALVAGIGAAWLVHDSWPGVGSTDPGAADPNTAPGSVHTDDGRITPRLADLRGTSRAAAVIVSVGSLAVALLALSVVLF